MTTRRMGVFASFRSKVYTRLAEKMVEKDKSTEPEKGVKIIPENTGGKKEERCQA